MTEPFDIVRRGYDAIGGRYRDWSHLSPVRLEQVERLLQHLDPNSLVVDLGCGPGEPATRLLAERHRVIGVDASARQLGLARQAAPTALLLQADMTRLSMRPGSLDAVASFYALGHVPANKHAALFAQIAEWLRPDGVLFTSAPVAAGESQDEDWLGVPMFFGGIGEAATKAALSGAGLDVEEWRVVPEDEGDGHVVEFVWLLARKRR